jgi:DNA-binding IclR family transcriptional regulator
MKSTTATRREPDASEATSSVTKACRILRALTQLEQPRLTDIAQLADLDKATVLRLMDALTREGFVRRDSVSKLYSPGPELLLAGTTALLQRDPRALARPSLLRLADEFEDTAILSVPSGSESLCLDLELGRYPIRANYLAPGHRRPLGVGAGSLALLAWMPEREREAVLDTVAAQLQRTRSHPAIDRTLLETKAAQSRERGYCVLLDVVVERMGGIAVPILGMDGRPVAALSIAALTDRITSREAALVATLQREAALCQALWAAPASRRT